MKPHLASYLVVSAVLLTLPGLAHAFGFGVAVSGGNGTLNETDSYTQNVSFRETRESVGAVYDSNLGQDRLFNYRGTLSYQFLQAEGDIQRYNLHGMNIENDFGFRLAGGDGWRFWAGPQVRVEILSGTYRYRDNPKEETANLGVGVGPVAGVNIDLGNDLTLTLKGGYIRLSGISLWLADWDEGFGIVSAGLMYQLGGDRKPR